jgi:BlaI family penicillinase repressor
MKKPPRSTLTEAEWAIMSVVWEHEPCAAGTVQEALAQSHGWAYSTVKTTMDRMVAKGLLGTHAIRNLNLFTSRVTREAARRGELHQLLRRAFNGALSPMIQFLVENERLSADEVQQLRRLLRKASDQE